MKNLFLTVSLIICSVVLSTAQINTPQPSPLYTESGVIGLAEVTITYSRPSLNGRTAFGDLVPYNDLWRAGANASTKISFSDDVVVSGNEIKAGQYAIYVIPTTKEWTIILNSNVTLWGTAGYSDKEDVARFTVPTTKTASKVETFTMAFSDFTLNTSKLNISWENTKVSFTIGNEVDSKVMAQIKAQVIDATPENAGTYFQAASYYFANGKDMNEALAFVNKAIEGGSATYWVIHLKAKLEAKLGKKAEAKASAAQSISLAKEAGNMDYVRLNEKLLGTL
jgi:hypothetical protein